jgi:hypothetical protein
MGSAHLRIHGHHHKYLHNVRNKIVNVRLFAGCYNPGHTKVGHAQISGNIRPGITGSLTEIPEIDPRALATSCPEVACATFVYGNSVPILLNIDLPDTLST